MRLRRLDLTRYGKFTGKVLDFGERIAGAPDLHVVYGPNEAGKSTAFAAFLDLLFGIETRSRYGFLHPYSTMQIGASLELSGTARELVRIKRPQRSLLDGAGQPLPEALLAGALGGIDRASYRTMFSLDDETLEAGGESILASRGDLGQLLFSASAGLADLAGTLVDLRAEAGRFYRFGGQGHELGKLKLELAALKSRRDEIDILASTFVRLMAERDGKAGQYEAALAARGRTLLRRDEVQRLLTALPRMASLRATIERLDELAAVPEPPPGWADIVPGLREDDIAFERRSAGTRGEIALISGELDAMIVDEAALRLAGCLDRLAGLRARAVTAELDIPARAHDLLREQGRIAAILAQIGRAGEPEPARLMISAALAAELRALIRTWSGIATEAQLAADEQADAVHRLAQARRAHREAGGGAAVAATPAQMATVAACVEALRASDHAARHKFAGRTARQQGDQLARHLAGLLPWQGSIAQLGTLHGPAAGAIEAWTRQLRLLGGAIDLHGAEAARLDGELARRQTELSASREVADIVGDQDAAAIRGTREAAWADHRRALSAATADAFEGVLRRDDQVTASRFGHEREVAKLHEMEIAVAGLRAESARVRALLETARAGQGAVHAEIEASAAAMWPGVAPSITRDITLERLQAWLALRAEALATQDALRQAECHGRDADEDEAALRLRLAGALATAAVPHDAAADAGALLAVGRAALERATRLAALHETVAACERDAETRERAVQKASEADRRWIARWAAACGACWLGEAGAAPAAEAVGDMLAALAGLGTALEAAAGLAGRIEDMERDRAEFEREVAGLWAELGMAADGGAALERADAIAGRIAAAQATRTAVTDRQAALAAARLRGKLLGEEMVAHAARAGTMMAFFGSHSLAEVADRMRDAAAKAALLQAQRAGEQEICAALRVEAIAAAQALLDAADRPGLEMEAAALGLAFDEQDCHTRELFAAMTEAARQLDAVGGDDAVARIEEKRRTILLDIEYRALRYLRLRAGIVAADQALRAYRDKHRSAMMQRASEAFHLLSRGAYQGLSTRPEKDAETLIAVGKDGSKLASDLSKGTRFQLYLALRAAGYHELAQHRPAVPFIADDIMETFDDFRAEEAFRLFAEMAHSGQVVYLTHHRHLCDIARLVAPGVRVHELA